MNELVETRLSKLPDCDHPKRPILFAEHAKTGAMKIIQGYCGQWRCLHCGPANAIAWGKKIAYGATHYGGEWYLVTLTAHKWQRGQDASLANLRRGWDLISKRVRRAGLTGHYARIWERHQDDTLHIHILTDIPIPTKTSKKGWVYSPMLRLFAVQAQIGHNADIVPLDDATGAIYYAAKYLSKQVGDDSWPANLRRVQTSHKWPEIPGADYEDPWIWKRVTDLDADRLYAWHKRCGDDIKDYRPKDKNPDHKNALAIMLGPL